MAGVPTRKQIVARLRKFTPRTMNSAIAYNSRADENSVNAVSWWSYRGVGGTRALDALANALESQPSWPSDLAGSLSYDLLATRLAFFWHRQYDVLFPSHPQPIHLMDWELETTTMAMAFMLGWREQAVIQGYIATATLNQDYSLATGYDERHRRGHAFMLRLFAAWRGDGTGHRFPEWASSVPVYETLLQRWRVADSRELAQLLYTACEHHLQQGIQDTTQVFHDFGDDRLTRVPLEILMVMRLREIEGLSVPSVVHPLMEAPFNALLPSVPVPEPDEYMKGTMKRVHEDWPQFDDWMTLEALRRQASLQMQARRPCS
jgi:hypothetical protein